MPSTAVKLISITPNAEETMADCARVSNPSNQNNPEHSKLLNYCIKHGHWSVFEMANMVLEIKTSRAIASQILRHRSFTFQEFSQRYASPQDFELYEARRQDSKDRQNSIDDLPHATKEWFRRTLQGQWNVAKMNYDQAISMGIAKECARFILPLTTSTTLYMNGSIRSWVHFLELRTSPSTQLEHRAIALSAKQVFVEQLPTTAKALGWSD